jgi:hypothetical protein
LKISTYTHFNEVIAFGGKVREYTVNTTRKKLGKDGKGDLSRTQLPQNPLAGLNVKDL